MAKSYTHPEARNVNGKDFGLAVLARVSELSLAEARPIEWHRHDETEIICCLKGALDYELRGRLSVSLPTGCFLIIPGGLEHRLAGGVDGPCRRLSLFLRHSVPTGAKGAFFSRTEYRELLADLLKKRLVARPFSAVAREHLVDLANRTALPRRTRRELLEMRAAAATVLLAFAAQRTNGREKQPVRMFDEAVTWLKAHYTEKISLGQLTSRTGYGTSQFCALFKKETGLPPLEWLTRYRIAKACNLLKSGDHTVKSVARAVGFSDPGFFTRVFRRHVGKSPSAYAT